MKLILISVFFLVLVSFSTPLTLTGLASSKELTVMFWPDSTFTHYIAEDVVLSPNSESIASMVVTIDSSATSSDQLGFENEESYPDLSFSFSYTDGYEVSGTATAEVYQDILNKISYSRSDKDTFTVTSPIETYSRTLTFTITTTGGSQITSTKPLAISRAKKGYIENSRKVITV